MKKTKTLKWLIFSSTTLLLGLAVLCFWYFDFFSGLPIATYLLPLIGIFFWAVAGISVPLCMKSSYSYAPHCICIVSAFLAAVILIADMSPLTNNMSELTHRKEISILLGEAGFLFSIMASTAALVIFYKAKSGTTPADEEQCFLLNVPVIFGGVAAMAMLLFWLVVLPLRILPFRP